MSLTLSGQSLLQPSTFSPSKRSSHGAKFANELYKKLHRGRPPAQHSHPPQPSVSDLLSINCLLGPHAPSLVPVPRTAPSRAHTARRSAGGSRGLVLPSNSPAFSARPLQPSRQLSKSTTELSAPGTPIRALSARPCSAGYAESVKSNVAEENDFKLPDLKPACAASRVKSSPCNRHGQTPEELHKYHLEGPCKSPPKQNQTRIDLNEAVFYLRVVGDHSGVIRAPIPLPEDGEVEEDKEDSESDCDEALRKAREEVNTHLKRSQISPFAASNISYKMFNFGRLVPGLRAEEEEGKLPKLDKTKHMISQNNGKGTQKDKISQRVRQQPDFNMYTRNSFEDPDFMYEYQADMYASRNQDSSFITRYQYGRNLEKNWLKQYQEIKERKRKHKQEQKLVKWVKKHTKKQDDFYSVFYSSGEEDGEVQCATRPSSASSSCVSTSLLRYASLDVLVSDSDHEEDACSPDIYTVLKDKQVEEREVWYKSRRKYHRHHLRYANLIVKQEEREAQDGMGAELLENMTDKEIRAMRLRLIASEKEYKDTDDFVLGDHTSIRALAAEILSGLNTLTAKRKPQVKKKKKNKKRKSLNYNGYVRNTPVLSMKDRFMADFGHLMSKQSLKPKSAVQVQGQTEDDNGEENEVEEEETPVANTEDFLKEVEKDQLMIRQMSLSKLNRKPQSRNISKGITDSEAEDDEDDGSNSDESEDEYGRGTLNKTVIRRNSLPMKDKPGVLTFRTVRQRNMCKPERSQRRMSRSNSVCVSDAPRRRSSSIFSNNGSRPGSATSQNSLPFVYENVTVDVSAGQFARRPHSARRMCRDEDEINLYDLTAGIDFPAKDIKIKIVERRRRRQRNKKKLLKAQKLEDLRNPQKPAVKVHSESSDVESEEEPCSPPPKLPSFLQKKKPMSFGADSPFVSAMLSQNYMSQLRMKYSNEELDDLIARLSELFLDMKDCRYLRWSPRDWAIIERLMELELLE